MKTSVIHQSLICQADHDYSLFNFNRMKRFLLLSISTVAATMASLLFTACIPTSGGTSTVTIPTLSATTSVSAITTSGGMSGGTITSNGGATITASGIVWGTSTNPTIALSTKTTTSPVVTSGAFTGTMSGLTAGATYYVRAYATNSVGTGYGAQTTFATSTSTSTGNDVPAVFSKFYGASSVTVEGNYIVIKCNGLPDHKSPYYANTQWSGTMYEADNDPDFHQAPGNKIASWDYTFKIPNNPTMASTHQSLGSATIGVAVNGVAIFNQYAAGNKPIVVGQDEYISFDQYGGHPTPFNEYHYHIEPYYITANKGSDALIGFLLDGFPVYGPKENGVTVTNSDLDTYHGHFGVTADYPNGIYHYHTTSASPFINGNGYYGTAGTWSKQ